jgi:RHS repeat-associated protein
VRFHDGNGDGDYLDAGDSIRYFTADANYNVTAMIDAATGDVVERYVYAPYGEATVYSATWTNPTAPMTDGPLYAGYFLDAETGLYQLRNRCYDSSLSAFISRDPVGYTTAEANLYGYCGGSPISAADPNGTGPLDTLGNVLNTIAGAVTLSQGFGGWMQVPFPLPPPLPPFGYTRLTGTVTKGKCCCPKNGQMMTYAQTRLSLEIGISAKPVLPEVAIIEPFKQDIGACPEKETTGDLNIGIRGTFGPIIGTCKVSLLNGESECAGALNWTSALSGLIKFNVQFFVDGTVVMTDSACW